jgi:soluble lytic murein transglycosylase
MRRIIAGNFLTRMMAFTMLVWSLSIYHAWSTKPVVKKYSQLIFEINRVKHAQELLTTDSYLKSDLKNFEGDSNIADYIEKFIQQENPKLNAQQLTQTLLKVSHDYSYDPVFLLAVIKTESQFNPNTIGSAGEIGLMQVKPDTAEWICKKRKIAWLGAEKMKDPNYNIVIGAHYFHYLKNRLASEGARYINAYNMGINNLQRLPASDQKKRAYYSKIISNYLGIYSAFGKFRSII